MGEPAVSVQGLDVERSGKSVLSRLWCQTSKGTISGVLGPNGSGKSTLLRAIVGVQTISSGVITVFGQMAGSSALRSRIGYATQAPALYSDLTVRESLRYFADVLGTWGSTVDEVIEQVGLRDSAHLLVGRLSGGQRGRANLAVALLGRPELLVLDEPTVGSDPELRDELWGLFRLLAASGSSLLISTHVMEEAARCDHLLLLRDGQLLAEGSPGELCVRTASNGLEQAFLRLVKGAEAR